MEELFLLCKAIRALVAAGGVVEREESRRIIEKHLSVCTRCQAPCTIQEREISEENKVLAVELFGPIKWGQ